MVDINVERTEVAAMYPGPGWKQKVKHMPDAQVHAIYMKEQKRKADELKKEKEEPEELW